MPGIAIHDANMLVDLTQTGLPGHCLNPPYEFSITNLIFDELHAMQQEEIKLNIAAGKFSTIMIVNEDLFSLKNLAENDNKPSEQDWSGLYFAEKN